MQEATLLTLLLLLFTSKNVYSYEDWVYSVQSSYGNKISDSLIVLKSEKSLYIPICSFFEITGANVKMAQDRENCIISSLDNKLIITKKSKVYLNNKVIANLISNNGEAFVSFEFLKEIDYSVENDTENVLLIVDHNSGLPIDTKMKLKSQLVLGETKEVKSVDNDRANFSFNRFEVEFSRGLERELYSTKSNFDLLGGELKTYNCNEGCVDTFNWYKEYQVGDYHYDFLIGNNVNYYYPEEFDILDKSIEINVSKAKSKKVINLAQSDTNEYFIYKNKILVNKGKGSLEDVYLDLSGRNYSADYTVKLVDERGRVEEIDLATSSALLKKGDFKLSGIYDDELYKYTGLQLGVHDNFNMLASNISKSKESSSLYGGKFNFENLTFESLKLDSGEEIKNFEELTVRLNRLSYSYGHYFSKSTFEEDKQVNTISVSNNLGLFQGRYTLTNHKQVDRDYLFGKQFSLFFLSVEQEVKYDNSTSERYNFSSQIYDFKFDVGFKTPWKTLEKYMLVSYEKEKYSLSFLGSQSPNQSSYTLRMDYNINNWQLYSSYKQGDTSEILVGAVFSLFPNHYSLDLKERANTLILVKVYLDENGNNIKDPEEDFLESIGGVLNSQKNKTLSDKNGLMIFDQEGSSKESEFFFDETSFKHIYLKSPDESLAFKILPRKVNEFEVGLKLNGVILLDCSENKKVYDLKVFNKKREVILERNKCRDHIILDGLSAGEYYLESVMDNNKIREKIELSKSNSFYNEFVY